MLVDNAIRTWLTMTVEDQWVDHERLGETVGRCLGVFYADDGMVGSRDADWLYHLGLRSEDLDGIDPTMPSSA